MSLEGQIETYLRAIIADDTLEDLSKQREAGAEDTSKTTTVCLLAASDVESYLGAVADTDYVAIKIGVQLALYHYQSTYTSMAMDKSEVKLNSIYRILERLAESRRQEADIGTATPDFINLDKKYNITNWDNPDDDE